MVAEGQRCFDQCVWYLPSHFRANSPKCFNFSGVHAAIHKNNGGSLVEFACILFLLNGLPWCSAQTYLSCIRMFMIKTKRPEMLFSLTLRPKAWKLWRWQAQPHPLSNLPLWELWSVACHCYSQWHSVPQFCLPWFPKQHCRQTCAHMHNITRMLAAAGSSRGHNLAGVLAWSAFSTRGNPALAENTWRTKSIHCPIRYPKLSEISFGNRRPQIK